MPIQAKPDRWGEGQDEGAKIAEIGTKCSSKLLVFAFAVCLLSSATHAQSSGNSLPGFSSENSKKPIDIDSDRLEVDDHKLLAIYTGNVSATQGDNNVRAARLEVVYERASASTASTTATQTRATSTTDTAASDMGGQQIKTITAIGNVIVTSYKDGQTATGDQGFFDVKAQKIIMTVRPETGHCVILTKKGNIAKGDRLTVDMERGTSDLEPGPKESPCHKISTFINTSKDPVQDGKKPPVKKP